MCFIATRKILGFYISVVSSSKLNVSLYKDMRENHRRERPITENEGIEEIRGN